MPGKPLPSSSVLPASSFAYESSGALGCASTVAVEISVAVARTASLIGREWYTVAVSEIREVREVREVAIERVDGAGRRAERDRVVVEEPLQLRARGAPVATVMRTPGHDLELVRGLLHGEGLGSPAIARAGDDAVEIDVEASVFAGRGLLASAACGVCGRVAIADLELRAREVAADTAIDRALLARLPDALRAAQSVFAATGGLHAAGLFDAATGELAGVREDVGRHNAVDKLVGWALGAGLAPSSHVLFLSGRLGYELVQKAIAFGVPIVAAVSAPSSLAIELAERFNVALAGFVRGERANLYAHAWRVRG
ncbi:MAG: formate dehydrogenase accessory sulfurtransferase FdhD [Deltaproteobacteria bacterium]|nr:formate dehydrogenase accessory sulfurtransferase FdhD [Deltaproteobacteria bacterium]MCW5802724.1 formate dehydrogenase accessory sulfurtransferase FdhD [Deltaproteobacteria bacterium]